MLSIITKRIVLFFQFIIRIFKRALCCFKRTRRNSSDTSPLTDIGVVSNGEIIESQTWGSWEEPISPLNPVEEKIRMYRQQRANIQQTKQDEEAPLDFFLDMTPRIVKQKKLLLQNQNAESQDQSSNFSLAPEPVFNTSELGEWEENPSWEAQADGGIDVSDVLREQKRLERDRRQMEQQRRKHEQRIRHGVSTRSS